MVISAPTNPPVVAGRRTRCSHTDIIKVWCKYQAGSITKPSWVVQTGRTSTTIYYVGSLTCGLQFTVIDIPITHMLLFWAFVSTIIATGLVSQWDNFIPVTARATGTGILTIAAAAAATPGHSTGGLITVVMAASRLSTMLVGAAARSCSVCQCGHCMLCRFASGVPALHPQEIHG